MYIEDEIKFQKAIPNPELIIEQIRIISGLSDLIWNDSQTKLVHSDFTTREFFFYSEGNSIHLGRGWDDQWYLLDVSITALISLGGSYTGRKSESGKKKWKDVKDTYPFLADPRPEK